MSAKTKLLTNVGKAGYLTGLEYAAPSKQYPDQPQVKVSGRWESPAGLVDEHFWLSYFVAKVFTEAGLAKFAGMAANNTPLFQVLAPQQRLWIIREENGTKKVTSVRCIDAAGQPVQLQAQATPPDEKTFLQVATPAAASAAPGPAGAPPVTAAPSGPPPAAAVTAPPPASGRAPLTEEQKAAAKKEARIQATLAMADLSELGVLTLRMALRAALDVLGITLDAYVAMELTDQLRILEHCRPSADSLKITADRWGIRPYLGMVQDVEAIPLTASGRARLMREALTGMHLAPPPMVEPAPTKPAVKLPQAIEDMPEAQDEEDDDLPF